MVEAARRGLLPGVRRALKLRSEGKFREAQSECITYAHLSAVYSSCRSFYRGGHFLNLDLTRR